MTGTEGVLSRGIVSDGCRDRYVSISKARLLLGYKPRVGLEEGLRISCQVSTQRLKGERDLECTNTSRIIERN